MTNTQFLELKQQITEDVMAGINEKYLLIPKVPAPAVNRADLLVEAIMTYVACCTGISIQDMQSKSRNGNAVRSRFYVSIMARELGGLGVGLQVIGKHLHKDHASVIHYIRRFKEESAYNKELVREESTIRAGFLAQYGEALKIYIA
jgi:chromosomal replication initiation ATPase DnaA